MQIIKTNVYELTPADLQRLVDAEIAQFRDGICVDGCIKIVTKHDDEEVENDIGYLSLDESWMYDENELLHFHARLTSGTYLITDYDLVVTYVPAETSKDID